jgi:hypothetical protein
VFFYLLAAHAVADFPLQAGPMATEKCRHSPTDLQRAVPWYYWLTAHALVHGGAVSLVTGSVSLGLLETVAHWLLDFAKCERWTGMLVDQLLHVGCKVVWCVLLARGVVNPADAYLRQWLWG